MVEIIRTAYLLAVLMLLKLLTPRVAFLRITIANKKPFSSIKPLFAVAGGKSKSKVISIPDFEIVTGVFGIAKNDKDAFTKNTCTPLDCGEDSYCISGNDEELVLGVADGVGGWQNHGINPAYFSRTLMRHTAELSKISTIGTDPKTILYEAFMGLIEESKDESIISREKPYGSSTACIVMINKTTGKLRFGNLGDSGFMILSRKKNGKYKIKYKSEAQQHRFNVPYQLTLYPEAEISFKDDTPYTATDVSLNLKLKLKVGDVILVMTDGILDNLFNAELEEIISNSVESQSDPNLFARELTMKAREYSLDKSRSCPFSVEAVKNCMSYGTQGGKVDDMTIIAAFINKK